MTNFQEIPLFPLQLVMFPGGRLDMEKEVFLKQELVQMLLLFLK